MKRIYISIISFLFISLSFAQDSLTIVAVGEAEVENEKIAFVKPASDFELGARDTKLTGELMSLLISDFSFYKHLFEVIKSPIPQGTSEAWAKESFRYVVDSKLRKVGVDIFIDLKVLDIKDKKTLLTQSEKIAFSNIRSFGHELSNTIYKSITNKDSIFKSKIVFVSDRTSVGKDTRKELYIMDFDGNRKQRLTYNNSMIISPSIAPDNQKIVYSVIEAKWQKAADGRAHKIKNINLYVMDLITKKTTLISGLSGINSGAVFTADGKEIYLTLSHLKNADIFKMNLQTKQTTKITKHFLDDVDPHINKEGTLMTFLSGRSGKAMIYTMDPRGLEKDIKRISYVGRYNAAPRFSPDGKEIVFSSWVDNRFDLYKIDSDGNNLVRLTKNFGSNEEAWFSPDGQFIVFTSQRVISQKKAVQNIYIMNREGEILSKITEEFGKSYTPRWSN